MAGIAVGIGCIGIGVGACAGMPPTGIGVGACAGMPPTGSGIGRSGICTGAGGSIGSGCLPRSSAVTRATVSASTPRRERQVPSCFSALLPLWMRSSHGKPSASTSGASPAGAPSSWSSAVGVIAVGIGGTTVPLDPVEVVGAGLDIGSFPFSHESYARTSVRLDTSAFTWASPSVASTRASTSALPSIIRVSFITFSTLGLA